METHDGEIETLTEGMKEMKKLEGVQVVRDLH